MKTIHILPALALIVSCSTAPEPTVHLEDSATVTHFVFSQGSNLHYAGSASSGFKEDLSRRIGQFQEYSPMECFLGLARNIPAEESTYMGYSYVEMLGEDGRLEIWLMVLGDEVPAFAGVKTSGKGVWKVSEIDSATVGEDASIFLLQSSLTKSLKESDSTLSLSISNESDQEMSWEI